MTDDEHNKLMGEMLERGIERQLEGHYEAIHGRIDDSSISDHKPSGDKDLQTSKENSKKTAGSSRPLRTGIGDRFRNHKDEE